MSGQSWSNIGNINYEEFVGMLFKEVREIILMSSSRQGKNISGLRSLREKGEGMWGERTHLL